MRHSGRCARQLRSPTGPDCRPGSRAARLSTYRSSLVEEDRRSAFSTAACMRSAALDADPLRPSRSTSSRKSLWASVMLVPTHCATRPSPRPSASCSPCFSRMRESRSKPTHLSSQGSTAVLMSTGSARPNAPAARSTSRIPSLRSSIERMNTWRLDAVLKSSIFCLIRSRSRWSRSALICRSTAFIVLSRPASICRSMSWRLASICR